MSSYIVRRVTLFIPTLILVSVVVFLQVRLIPGNPAYVLLGPNATEEQVISVTHSLALDQPIWTQYIVWVGRILHGSFGDSYINDYPVTELILQKLPSTLELAVAALIISVAVSFPLGILSAISRRGGLISVISLYNALAVGMPVSGSVFCWSLSSHLSCMQRPLRLRRYDRESHTKFALSDPACHHAWPITLGYSHPVHPVLNA